MRTTLVIDDELFVYAKKLAADRRSSLSGLLNEALRGYLTRGQRSGPVATFRMPTFHGDGEVAIDTSPADLRTLEDAEAELEAFR